MKTKPNHYNQTKEQRQSGKQITVLKRAKPYCHPTKTQRKLRKKPNSLVETQAKDEKRELTEENMQKID